MLRVFFLALKMNYHEQYLDFSAESRIERSVRSSGFTVLCARALSTSHASAEQLTRTRDVAVTGIVVGEKLARFTVDTKPLAEGGCCLKCISDCTVDL